MAFSQIAEDDGRWYWFVADFRGGPHLDGAFIVYDGPRLSTDFRRRARSIAEFAFADRPLGDDEIPFPAPFMQVQSAAASIMK